jgi:nucleotide-binding universal stress UspA family protein
MNLNKILWTTDGSKESSSSLRYAAFFAEKYKAEILALFVSEIRYPIISLYPIPEDYILDIAKRNESKFQKRFKALSKMFQDRGLSFTSKIVRENVVDGIIKTAKNNNCDLIVMGKHGLGFIERTILGSNTAKVIKKTQIQVLSTSARGRKKITDISKILVPVDVTNTDGSSVLTAFDYAHEFNASVTLIYVFWLNEKINDVPPNLLRTLVLKANRQLKKTLVSTKQKWTKSGKKFNIDVDTEIIYGINPGRTVTWYAKKKKFDMIIMNTHSRSGITRLVMGSEAEKIIRTSSCPVLIEKP